MSKSKGTETEATNEAGAATEATEAYARDGFRAVSATPVDLGILSEIHARLSELESRMRDIHLKVDAATKSGELDPGLLAKLAHIATKFFPHDEPETEQASAPRVPRFDPFTGHPLQ